MWHNSKLPKMEDPTREPKCRNTGTDLVGLGGTGSRYTGLTPHERPPTHVRGDVDTPTFFTR